MPTSEPVWQRLHPATVAFGVVGLLWRNVIPLLLAGFLSNSRGTMFYGLTGYLALMMLVPFLRYFSYRYRLTDGKIVIHEGLLSRNLRTIPVHRIHNINTSRNPAARLLGVVRLDLETAGGGQAEASLAHISRAAAEQVYAFVRREKDEAAEAPGHDAPHPADTPTAQAEAEAETARPAPRRLFQMSVRDVLLAGATSNRVGAVAFGLILLSQYMELTGSQVLPEWFMARAQEVAAGGIQALFYAALTFGALFLGAWLFGIATTLVRWYGFTLNLDGDDLHIRSGLFTVREYTVPRGRIQALHCVTTALRRPLRLFHIQVRSAGHVGMQEQTRVEADMLAPLCRRDDIARFAAYAFEDADWDGVVWHGVHPYTRLRQWLGMLTLLTLLALLSATFLPTDWTAGPGPALLFVPAIGISFAVAHLNWKQTAYGYDARYVYIKTGFLGLHYQVIPIANIQNLAVSQAPGQRSRGLAALHLDVAGQARAVDAGIPNLPLQEAWLLFHRFGNPAPRRRRGGSAA